MNESVELFVLVVAIYLYECAQWVPAAASSFGMWWPGRWRLRRPWRPSARWGIGAAIGTPWPPLAPTLVTEALPLVCGPAGVSTLDQRRFRAWDEIQHVTAVQRRIEIDGEPWASTATRRLATTFAEALAALPALPAAARGKRIVMLLDARLRRETVRERRAALRRDTRLLAVAANVLWVGVFAGLPVLLWTPWAHFWLELLGLILVGWVVSAAAFALALRRGSATPRDLWPDRAHRWLVYASPLSALRARDVLARELLGDLDPLCAAAELLPARAFAEQARRALAELVHRDQPGDAGDPAQREDARWLREAQRARLETLLRASSLDPAALLRAPPREDDQRRAYCPLCLTQYAHGAACANAECNGLRLVPFEATQRA